MQVSRFVQLSNSRRITVKKRIDWLDIGKGVGILLVMLGHADIPSPLRTYIYTFHMPFFFFLSGYLFTMKKFPNLSAFLSKRTKTLITPYLFFSFIAYLWFIFVYILGKVDYHHSLLTPLLGSLIATRKTEWTVHTGPLWFINCLLLTELFFYLITKTTRKKRNIGILLLVISILGCYYNKMVGKPLPWSIDVAMISVGFYGAGFLFKEFESKLERFLTIKTFFLLFAVNAAAGYLNFVNSGERVDLYNSSLGNIFLFYLSAFSGTGAFIIFLKRLKKSKGLQYIGENSIIYLALHQKIVFFLFNQIIQNSGMDSDKLLEIPMVKGALYTIIAAVILLPAVYWINQYLPFILGKTNKRYNGSLEVNGYR